MAGMASGTGNHRAPLRERKDDLYETPEAAVEALLRHVKLPHHIWEPACGPGAIARVLRDAGHEVWASDLVDYESPDQNESRADFLFARDNAFLMELGGHRWHAAHGAIVTNPPFKLAEQFVAHALDLCPRVIMLLRLAFLESERRSPILDNAGLAGVYVFRKRLPMMHRAGWEGRKANSGMAFAWFDWQRGYEGPPLLHRISWDR